MAKSDQSMERKKQIVRATIDCISRFGYHNFSMQDVARVADVSKGIIHYYFMNKEDLMKTVLIQANLDIENLLLATKVEVDPAKRLVNALWMCASIVQTKREYYKVHMDFWIQIDQKEDVRQIIASHYARLRKGLASLIQQGIDQKIFREGNASHFASCILALVDGIALQWLFDSSVFQYDDMVKDCEFAVLTFLKRPGEEHQG